MLTKKTIAVTKKKKKKVLCPWTVYCLLTEIPSHLYFAQKKQKKTVILYRLVVQFGLQLLRVCHLPHSFHEILLSHVLMVGTNGKHTYWTKMRRGHTVGILEAQKFGWLASCY